jgi:hypothetical protein
MWLLLAAIFEMSFASGIAASVFLRVVVAIPFDDGWCFIAERWILKVLWMRWGGHDLRFWLCHSERFLSLR